MEAFGLLKNRFVVVVKFMKTYMKAKVFLKLWKIFRLRNFSFLN